MEDNLIRKIRSNNQNFIKLCLNSELSSEITLQPIKRFDLDSAIIFSDILMVPYALGQKVEFIKDRGPKLSDFDLNIFLKNNKITFTQKLLPVYKAIEKTRKELDKKKSLISFIGAPWTLLIYMLNAKESKNILVSKRINSKEFEVKLILDKLIDFYVYIENQVNAGADASANGFCHFRSRATFQIYAIPNSKIVKFCKQGIPVIYFLKH